MEDAGFPLVLDRPLAVLDLETTGLDTRRDRIVELAVLRLSPSGDVEERVRRFNPGIPIPPEATAVHGIADADVAQDPPFAARARSLADLLEPCDLAGFNIRRFDLPMLLEEFQRSGVDFPMEGRRTVDVQAIYHALEPRDLSAAARYYLGREHEDAHSALGDIRTTLEVLGAQLHRYTHLPRTLAGLHDFCDEIRPLRSPLQEWFRGDKPPLFFRKGKHRGRSLEEVAREEGDYLRWLLGLDDLHPQVRQAVAGALTPAARSQPPPA